MIDAAEKGDLKSVKHLIAEGADVNANKYSVTALMAASEKGHLAIVQELLAKGAEVDAKSETSTTALMVAASEGHLAIVQALLAKGADVNAKTDSRGMIAGMTSLMAASQEGYLAIVQALLAKGANVNAKDETGRTALLAASINEQTEVLQTLLAAGANVIVQTNKETKTPKDSQRPSCQEIIDSWGFRTGLVVVPKNCFWKIECPPGKGYCTGDGVDGRLIPYCIKSDKAVRQCD